MKNFLFVWLRIFKYKWLSNCRRIEGYPNVFHPVLINGKGKVVFGKNVQIGVINSPHYYSHYSYIEARHENSLIEFGNNVSINNAFSVVSFSKISIGDDVLIGGNCSILDNDGHQLSPENRNEEPISEHVFIGENVFIGNNVTILKGVEIGKNSVVANGSIVTISVPENVLVAGVPAKIIKQV